MASPLTAEETQTSTGDTEPAGPGRQLVEFVNQPWVGDLDGMLERGMIRALVVYSKTMYFSDKGKQRGIDYEMLSAFEKHINERYPPKVKHIKTYVVFIPTSRDDLIPALLEGRGDVAAAALTITPERQQRVAFSAPLFRDIDEIVVTGPESPELSTLDDLSGKELFIRRSSSYWEHLERLNARFAEEGKAPVKLRPAPEELQDEDLMEMLNAGLGGIIVVDDYKAEIWSEVFPDIRLHREIAVNTGGEIGWMVRPDNPELKAEIDAFAKTHKQGTTFGNILVRRYVDKSRFIKSATNPKELEKFQKVVGLFRRYADQYDLDHMLMMAQAYQESQLDHKAKSRVGAVGIMQLLPATGEEMKVGDIRQLEPNIHAGVKYIRHISDTYFKDEPMDELNRTLFAFAAYNAGPGRIRQLRRATAERGLNPNVWSNNVEVLAAEKIGMETVTYVSNIHKYYIVYKLVEEEERARASAKAGLAPAGSAD
jgi:membrane-bound lytic murein transglycosylase MltF